MKPTDKHIRSKFMNTILERYDGPDYVRVIHRDDKGEPITTCTIHTGDYQRHDASATPEWLEKTGWEPLGDSTPIRVI